MIVCVCNALRESQVRSAARSGAGGCAKTVYASLGCKPQCGQCLPYARKVVRDAVAGAGAAASA